MKVKSYGVVQGRLLPQTTDFIQDFPTNNWVDEFVIASKIGCDHIEWIVTGDKISYRKNPLMSNLIRDDITYINDDMGVHISGICLDSLITVGICGDAFDIIDHCSYRAASLGIGRVILPLLETASVRLPSLRNEFLDGLNRFNEERSDEKCFLFTRGKSHNNIELSLETDLPADDVVSLLDEIHSILDVKVSVTLDIGNLLMRGFDVKRHVDTYGDKITNLHVKDATLGIGTSSKYLSGETIEMIRDIVSSCESLEYVTFQMYRDRSYDGHDCIKQFINTCDTISCALI